MLDLLAKDVQKEMTKLCAKSTNSIFRQSSLEAITTFNWNTAEIELQQLAPPLYSILKGCVNVKRKRQRTKNVQEHSSLSSKDTATIGVCAAILLRHKSVHVNTFQHVISLVLHSGHSGKQVIWCYSSNSNIVLFLYTFNCVGICSTAEATILLSRFQTIKYLDHIGEGCDASVIEWCTGIQCAMRGSTV